MAKLNTSSDEHHNFLKKLIGILLRNILCLFVNNYLKKIDLQIHVKMVKTDI